MISRSWYSTVVAMKEATSAPISAMPSSLAAAWMADGGRTPVGAMGVGVEAEAPPEVEGLARLPFLAGAGEPAGSVLACGGGG